MSDISDTVTVPADQYSEHVPDDRETIDIGISAFSDKLYLKFPRFDRRGTNDFCMSDMSILRALVHIKDPRRADGIEISPVKREMAVLREKRGQYTTDDPTRVTRVSPSAQDVRSVHQELVDDVTDHIDGIQDDEYWRGYRNGMGKAGEHVQWDDMAWIVLDKEWATDAETLATIGRWFIEDGVAVCSRTNALFPIPEWSTPTGSYVATISDVYDGTCPFCGADKDKHWECIKSPNSTRKPNVYKCNACGGTKRGITTG